VLERDVLPARLPRYSPRLLDELLSGGDIVWLGAGSLGTDDGKVALYHRDAAPLLAPRPKEVGQADRPSEPEHERIREILAGRGACFFRELQGANDTATIAALWDLVWAGEITNDSFNALRALAPSRRKASSVGAATRRSGRPRLASLTALGPPKAQGRWSLVSRELGQSTGSPVEVSKRERLNAERSDATARAHALAVTLLERHGVLTREAIRSEGIAGGFAGMYPLLKILEEGGQVRRGYFVAGLGGAQFAVPGAVDRLRAFREAPSEPDVVVVAATDPANAYGMALPWPVKGPQRAAGAYVLLADGLPSLYIEKGGRSLVALRDFDGSWETAVVRALTAMVGTGEERDHHSRFRRLVLETMPDELVPLLKLHGFVPTPKGLAKYA
jgi:ATP-dependent helicase Lhr and Lhr-like helicase